MNNISTQKTFTDRSVNPGCSCPWDVNCGHCILNFLHPYLTPENPHQLDRIQRLLQQFKETLEQEGWVSLNSDGQVQFITESAQQLLNQYFPPGSSDPLPMQLQFWLKHQISNLKANCNVLSGHAPLLIEKAGQQLLISLVPDPMSKQYLLLLEEQPQWKGHQSFSVPALESLNLTKREAQVLFWIAQDKSNAGIAKVLGCCEGTVRKHLENLYKKLGVQTRIGAVMVALEKLGLLQR